MPTTSNEAINRAALDGVLQTGREIDLFEGVPSGYRFWAWMALGAGLIAIGKTIDLPGPWPYTQAQFDYSAGFMRRGLFGAVFGHPLGLNHYKHFAVFSTVMLIGLYAALALLARASKLAERIPPGQLLAVYASSYSVTYLAHLNGYLDIPLALLCVGPLFIRSTSMRLAASFIATVLGILIHEQFFFAFLPVLAANVAFGAVVAERPSERRVASTGAVLLVVLGIGMTWYLGHRSISEAQKERLSQRIAATTDHQLDEDVLDVLPRTPQENLQIMRSVWSRGTFIPAQIESFLMFGPTAALLSWATFLLLRQCMPRQYPLLYGGALLATLAPLSLNLFGWDKNRWNGLLCLNAFLMLLMALRLSSGRAVGLPLSIRRACLVVMLLNMATGGGLMGYRQIRPFPFLRSLNAIVAKPPS
jgi:hypothetical protein